MRSLYRSYSFRLDTLWPFAHLSGAVKAQDRSTDGDGVMWDHPKTADRLSLLADQVRLAQTVTPDLVSHVIDGTCVRLPALGRTEKAARLNRLIEAGAWTEVALALIELELPQWQLRRLVHDDGEWLCSLSKQPNLPAEYDDTADARHENLPLALLSAFVEARRQAATTRHVSVAAVPQVKSTTGYIVCCDNFA